MSNGDWRLVCFTQQRTWLSSYGRRSVRVHSGSLPDINGLIPVFDEAAQIWKTVPYERVVIGLPLPAPRFDATRWESPRHLLAAQQWSHVIGQYRAKASA